MKEIKLITVALLNLLLDSLSPAWGPLCKSWVWFNTLLPLWGWNVLFREISKNSCYFPGKSKALTFSIVKFNDHQMRLAWYHGWWQSIYGNSPVCCWCRWGYFLLFGWWAGKKSSSCLILRPQFSYLNIGILCWWRDCIQGIWMRLACFVQNPQDTFIFWGAEARDQ